jgi:Arc/MetJ family transcription regulator
MAKMNISIDEEVREELFRLVPPRRRSQVVNEALRKELLHRKREQAIKRLQELRKGSAKLSSKEIVAAVKRDRTSTGR